MKILAEVLAFVKFSRNFLIFRSKWQGCGEAVFAGAILLKGPDGVALGYGKGCRENQPDRHSHIT
jgi:hypothetical protein